MIKNNSAAFILSSLLFLLLNCACYASSVRYNNHLTDSFHNGPKLKDTVPPSEVMDVINVIITSTDKFDIEAVANLYTPNAVIADDEPPYSWNGPTAGVQWVNAIEQVCKDTHLTKLKASIGSVNVFQQSSDNVYIVDYKTNREVPQNEAQIPRGYIRQMSAYRQLVTQIYPDKTVHCALLWTAEPKLMILSNAILASLAA